MKTQYPWGDCKVAFEIDDDLSDDDGRLRESPLWDMLLPKGWEAVEINGAGARLVVVFRVNCLLRECDGKKVLATLKKMGAVS